MKKNEKKFKINVLVPFVTMADIAFLLLIFLIVTSSIKKTNEFKIDIPESTQFDKIENKNIIEIYITKDANIIYNNKVIKYKKFKKQLLSGKKCIINCDENINFKLIYKIIELLKSKNYEKVLFSVKRKNSSLNIK